MQEGFAVGDAVLWWGGASWEHAVVVECFSRDRQPQDTISASSRRRAQRHRGERRSQRTPFCLHRYRIFFLHDGHCEVAADPALKAGLGHVMLCKICDCHVEYCCCYERHDVCRCCDERAFPAPKKMECGRCGSRHPKPARRLQPRRIDAIGAILLSR